MNDGSKQPARAGTADQVLELDPGCVLHDPDNPPGRIENVRDLEESYRATGGQQVPGFVYPHPELPGMFVCADGNRRLMACRILGLKFKTILLDRAPSKKELRRLRLTTNNVHKAMTPEQIAAEIGEHIAETGDTQEQAAAFFGLSAGYVSKLLAPSKSLCAELHPLRDNPAIERPVVGGPLTGPCAELHPLRDTPAIGRDVLRIIARMPTPELQRRLAERVLSTITAGGAEGGCKQGDDGMGDALEASAVPFRKLELPTGPLSSFGVKNSHREAMNSFVMCPEGEWGGRRRRKSCRQQMGGG